MVPREGGSAAVVFFAQMAAFAAIFYFLLIRPQKKEADRHKQMLESVGKGEAEVPDDRSQHRGDDREVVGGDEDGEADDGEDRGR